MKELTFLVNKKKISKSKKLEKENKKLQLKILELKDKLNRYKSGTNETTIKKPKSSSLQRSAQQTHQKVFSQPVPQSPSRRNREYANSEQRFYNSADQRDMPVRSRVSVYC